MKNLKAELIKMKMSKKTTKKEDKTPVDSCEKCPTCGKEME